MSSSAITRVSAESISTALHSPFVTSQGCATVANAVRVALTTSDGVMYYGEATPVAYITGETIASVLASVEIVAPDLTGLDTRSWRTVFNRLTELLPDAPSTRCALEMAALDAWSKATGCSFLDLCGGALKMVQTDITIPIVPNAAELTEFAWALGIRVFKIKVGDSSLDADFERVLAVRQAAPEARLRIDANQAFTPECAVKFVERLVAEGAHIELLEQPVPKEDFAGLDWVAARSPVPVFADESCRTPADAIRLAQTGIHGFNCKIQKSGIAGVLDIISIARSAGKKLMLGCMLETRRSIAVSLAIACGTNSFDFIDLDSHLLVNEEGENPYFQQEGACMFLP